MKKDIRMEEREKQTEGFPKSWVELHSPGAEEVLELARRYNVPQEYFTQAADPYEIPRREKRGMGADLFLLNYPIKNSDGSYDTRPVALIPTGEVLLIVYYGPEDFFQEYARQRTSFPEEAVSVEGRLTDFAFYLSKSYIHAIEQVNEEIRILERQIQRSTKSGYIEKNILLSRSLLCFRRATKENGPVLEEIANLPSSQGSQDQQAAHDVRVESRQAAVMAEDASEMMEKLSDLYSNVINNNLNEVMKTLTSITILMTVPTIIGGYWGMNTELPIQDYPFAFWWLLLLSVLIIILLTWYLKKKEYL